MINTETYRTIETSAISSMITRVLEDRGITFERKVEFPKRQYRILKTGVAARQTTKHLVTYKLTNVHIGLHGEALLPTIGFFNSYEKECSFQLRVGVYRGVCSNGCWFGEDFFEMRAKHRAGPTVEQKLKQLEYQIVAALDSLDDVLQDVEDATSQTLMDFEKISIVGNLNVPNKVKDRVIEHLVNGTMRPEDSGDSVWNLYQLVNEQRRLAAGNSTYAASAGDSELLRDIIDLAA